MGAVEGRVWSLEQSLAYTHISYCIHDVEQEGVGEAKRKVRGRESSPLPLMLFAMYLVELDLSVVMEGRACSPCVMLICFPLLWGCLAVWGLDLAEGRTLGRNRCCARRGHGPA